MRNIVSINEGWSFTKSAIEEPGRIPAECEAVTLPHTWNATDGQDGGNDYYRGRCFYVRPLTKSELPEGKRYFLEIEGANSSADVYMGSEHLCHHDGGYSTFRVDITDKLTDSSVLTVAVDNAPNDRVYPQVADFTFYGGLYRNVKVIAVPATHFDLEYYGGPGIQVTPTVSGADADVAVSAYTTNMQDGDKLVYTITDAEGKVVGDAEGAGEVRIELPAVHLWHGRRDPYLYTLTAKLTRGEETLDEVTTRFGVRTFEIDPERGFILNGEEYPLRGVSRHQDRLGIGNALLPEHHKEDMELIAEVGCTTIRLAHYQHAQYFYDLCDEYGMVIWAEIPYISNHMPTARENTISQMRELIVQNYNHPSIVVWGLSNEITMKGDADPDLLENHRILNDLCHEMDKTRLTTVAAVSPCPIDSPYIQIPDVVSYNHYFGWYGGETSMNGPWFDKFHATHPKKPIGCSEYGCEALNWHTSNPLQGDYTEEYQAYYHEELIKQLYTRKYMWATHVWNMFDFGADARSEGGENGQNHKGLVTMDRKYKKDSFFAYKAWLSDEPFVHITSKRYVDRVEDVTKVTVYSNQPEVELFANGASLGKKTAEDHFFRFEVENVGETKLEAVAGECRDESFIRKVDTFNEEYRLQEKNAILNWFDITEREGRFSINDKIGDIVKVTRGKLVMLGFALKIKKKMDKNKKAEKKGDDKKSPGFEFKMEGPMMDMLGSFTILRLSGMIGMVGVELTKKDLLTLNKKLNRVRKPKNK